MRTSTSSRVRVDLLTTVHEGAALAKFATKLGYEMQLRRGEGDHYEAILGRPDEGPLRSELANLVYLVAMADKRPPSAVLADIQKSLEDRFKIDVEKPLADQPGIGDPVPAQL